MQWGAATAGGFLGTVVLTVSIYAAARLSLTRLDLPALLGTTVDRREPEARALGATVHVALGIGFGLAHGAVLAAVNAQTWWGGLATGAAHGVLATLVLLPLVLPVMHPRQRLRPGDTTAIEPPGFACRHYGTATPVVLVAAHAAYGLVVGVTLQAAA